MEPDQVEFCDRNFSNVLEFDSTTPVGEGGFGVVFKATFAKKKKVAVKFLHEAKYMWALETTQRSLDPDELMRGATLAKDEGYPFEEFIKTLSETALEDAVKGLKYLHNAMAGMMNESTIMTNIEEHPNVVKFLGTATLKRPFSAEREESIELNAFFRGEKFAQPALISEFVEGQTLQEFLWKGKREPSALTKKNIAVGVARGMVHVHAAGVVHADLSARNVLLEKVSRGALRTLTPKITDFGTSFIMWDECKQHEGPPLKDLLAGWIMNIFPPEFFLIAKFPVIKVGAEARTVGYTKAGDVWQFGLLAYEMEAPGKFPFEEQAPEATDDDPNAKQSFWKAIRRVSSREKRVVFPHELKFPKRTFVSKIAEVCLVPEPDDRPTFEDLVHFLEDDTESDLDAALKATKKRPGYQRVVTYESIPRASSFPSPTDKGRKVQMF